MSAHQRIILGSGHLYRTDFTEGMTFADPETYCIEANRFSHIKNGFTMEYTQEKVREEDDMGLVSKTGLNVDSAKFTCSMMTLEGAMLKHVLATAGDPAAIEATSSLVAKQLTKIGGIDNENETPSLWIFHHPDKKDGDIWVMFVGTNNGSPTLEFKKDAVTLPNLEVDAEPMDADGRKVYFYEQTGSTSS